MKGEMRKVKWGAARPGAGIWGNEKPAFFKAGFVVVGLLVGRSGVVFRGDVVDGEVGGAFGQDGEDFFERREMRTGEVGVDGVLVFPAVEEDELLFVLGIT